MGTFAHQANYGNTLQTKRTVKYIDVPIDAHIFRRRSGQGRRCCCGVMVYHSCPAQLTSWYRKRPDYVGNSWDHVPVPDDYPEFDMNEKFTDEHNWIEGTSHFITNAPRDTTGIMHEGTSHIVNDPLSDTTGISNIGDLARQDHHGNLFTYKTSAHVNVASWMMSSAVRLRELAMRFADLMEALNRSEGEGSQSEEPQTFSSSFQVNNTGSHFEPINQSSFCPQDFSRLEGPCPQNLAGINEQVAQMLMDYLTQENARGNLVSEEELVAWYMEQAEEEIQTENQLFEQQDFVQRIVDRLINEDQTIIVCMPSEHPERPEERLLKVNHVVKA